MERVERLKLLFAQDASLLGLDTQLRPMSDILPNTESADMDDDITYYKENVDPNLSQEQNLKRTHELNVIGEERGHSTEDPPDAEYQVFESAAQKSAVYLIPDLTTQGPDTFNDSSFSPLIAISRFPYKYVKGELSQKIASQFFDGGKFWDRCWDLYYLHLPPHPVSRHMIFVPTTQVRAFFLVINRALQCTLSLSEDGLVSRFQNDGFPQPTFLGQSTSRQTKDRLESRIPPSLGWARPSSEMDEQYMGYEQMIESAWDTTKNIKRNTPQAKQQLRLQYQRRLAESLRRTQGYLGLRSDKADNTINDMSWEETGDAPEVPQALNFDKPARFPFWKEPIFIAVDVESNERNHNQITEVGISTLDTLDLVGIPPGADGSHWMSRIRSRHLRVKEYGHIINRDFVAGCPAYFDFGTSEWVSEKELATVVQVALRASSTGGETRHMVLVGHSIANDIEYLRQIGLRVEHGPAGIVGFRDTVDTVDTAEFFRIMRGEMTVRKLGALLQEFSMTGWHLHNAGNDARYTMEVLIQMVLDHSQ
ncbi:hypothetical protein BBP40_008010 [Aspergillus hancockii]|nr:hypothetical protein BBP40_008010 [Aspergillus hancockii]